MAAHCAQPLCFFLGYGGYAEATEGCPDCIGYGYAEATMWSSPTRRLCYPSAQTAYVERVLSKKNAAEDGYAEVRRIQQFSKFRFSKGTNVELKLRSTLQQSAGLVVF